MTVPDSLRTIDLARAVQMSVQQVRNYEEWGFLPPVERGKNGYRLYTSMHLAAIKTARILMRGYGWQETKQIMQMLHVGDLQGALAQVDAVHARLHSKRAQTEQARSALQALGTEQMGAQVLRQSRPLRVGEAAQRVGVRVSAIHFWEQQGLLTPGRDAQSRYRLYDEQQMQRLHVVVLLREMEYGFEAIHSVLDEMASGNVQKALEAVEQRRNELARASWACMEATAVLRDYARDTLNICILQ